MSQIFDPLKPTSGVTKLSQLYQIIRDHDQSNRSSFSGDAAPSAPVIGQLWEDTLHDKLFLYTAASGWAEVAVENIGLGLEIIAARGSAGSLDQRLDAQLNEDGTLKAATTLNPSQWYDLTVASGYVSTTSFRALGADYTDVYYPTRRLKINRAGGAYYTEVVSSSYSSPNTTVVTRDAVVASDLRSVSHSIISPKKASGGDGAVSFEMVSNMGVSSGGGSLGIGDSVIFANGTGTTTLLPVASYGIGRPIFLVNIHATQSHTFAAYSGQTINGAASVTVGPGQSVIIFNNGSAWYRLDVPSLAAMGIGAAANSSIGLKIKGPGNSSATSVLVLYDSDGALLINIDGDGTIGFGTGAGIAVEAWTNVSSFGAGWAGTNVSYMKDPFGFVHMKGQVSTSSGSPPVVFTLPSGYRPSQELYPLNVLVVESGPTYIPFYSIMGTAGTISIGMAGTSTYIYFDSVPPFKAA